MNIDHDGQQAGRESIYPLAEEELRREREEEAKKIRRLQLMISMVMSVIGQDPNLTVEEASELAAGAKRACSPTRSSPTICSTSHACSG